MSYSANQYNYATPQSSSPNLLNVHNPVDDVKYFTLFDNALDGSYRVISGDVGIWGNSISDSTGLLPEPLTLIVEEERMVSGFIVSGSRYSYPVDFTVKLYNNSAVLHTETVTGNAEQTYMGLLQESLYITHYVITITRISSANNVVRLFNVHNPEYIRNTDTLSVTASEIGGATYDVLVFLSDNIKINASEDISKIRNSIVGKNDTLRLDVETLGSLTNVHSIMKSPYREIFGKVYITYVDPMLDSLSTIDASSKAYNSNMEQLLDSITEADLGGKYFTLYENDLSGSYLVSSENTQVGWSSAVLSNQDGTFDEPPSVTISFLPRPVISLTIVFDDSKDNIVKDFNVTLIKDNGEEIEYDFTDNEQTTVIVNDEEVADVMSVTVTVYKVAKPNMPATIIDIPVFSTILYRGYRDVSELISVDLLEELTYDDEIEALGGISANEITIALDNSTKAFTDKDSLVAKQLRRNRKIVPWLGVEVTPGEIEWYTLGTFWSYKWDTPMNSLKASVVGFDTIGLLGTTSYMMHQVQINKSIGYLLEYVLEDAKKTLSFIEYQIDEALYDIIIPYAWFAYSSHAAALKKISSCYPMHVYCNRDGVICARIQKVHVDHYFDEWSDSTNVISTSYNTLYTTVPNIVNVTVLSPMILTNEQLVNDSVTFEVPNENTRILNFSKPYISDIVVNVDCSENVSYSYSVYSWGITFDFTGSGEVRSIECLGTCVDTSSSSVISKQDSTSVILNGAVTRDITSDFIQTRELANDLIGRLFSLAAYDKYDATVKYRGNIALSINDPILLHDGIAPDNRYNIKRHQLSWNGSLTGSADLNT